MKKGIVLGIVFLLFASILFVSAGSTVKVPGNIYNLSALIFSSSSAKIMINNVNSPILNPQTSPYTPVYPVEGMYPVVKNLYKSQFAGDNVSQATLIIFLEQNLTAINGLNEFNISINIDDKTFNISSKITGSNSAIVTINNVNSPVLSPQSAPYSMNNAVDGMSPTIQSIHPAQYAGDNSAHVILLLAYEINLTEECMENWTCSDWAQCLSNQQIRACLDSSNCGTSTNKPSETQSCSSSGIACHNESECPQYLPGSPFCDNNQSCAIHRITECLNPGTNQSYCNVTSVTQCIICSNGCNNTKCITLEPVKQCTIIGLRADEKYCSSDYQLLNQSSAGASCLADFECKTNSCLEGKCAGERNLKVLYWGLGIIAVIGLIFLIVHFLMPKSYPRMF